MPPSYKLSFQRALCERASLYQQQTARPNILKTAVAGARKLLGGVTAAFAGTFREDSAERMQLALDHLQTIAPPPAPELTHEDRVADLIDAYADPTLPRDCERIARAIASKAYRSGCCYATQEKIAKWVGLPRATLQLRLEEMERRKLIHVQRRISTSSITLLADGTLDALRLKKINKIKVRERVSPCVIRTFTTKTPPTPHETGVSRRQKRDSWPKNTTCSYPQIATQSIGENDDRVCASVPPPVVSATSSPQVTPEAISPARIREKAPVTASEKPREAQPKMIQKTQAKPTATSVAKKSTTPQNGKEETKKTIPASISPHPEPTTSAKALIAEGVTPARAHAFTSLFEPERIARNITLGLHRTKTNPPAYLLRLIQDDAASKRVPLGSEADQVRKHERPGIQRGTIAPTEAVEAREPVPPRVSPSQSAPRVLEAVSAPFPAGSEPLAGVDDPLALLPPEERASYARRAREEVLRATPWLGAAARERNGPMMQSLIRKRLRAMLAEGVSPPGFHAVEILRGST